MNILPIIKTLKDLIIINYYDIIITIGNQCFILKFAAS